jgi:phospholipid/cholesterol/gamma-HCH transport system substrate-binding protein
MVTQAQKARLGAFLVTAGVLFVVAVATLMGSSLWERRDAYVIRYEDSVSGLETGAPVKLKGVRVGTVKDVRVMPTDVRIVEVFISLDHGTPITADMRAVPVGQGITGLKFIELRGGSPDVRRLKPGEAIASGMSELDSLTGRAEAIAFKMEQLLNNLLAMTDEANRERFVKILDQGNVVLEDAHRVAGKGEVMITEITDAVAENRRNVRLALQHLVAITEHLASSGERFDKLIDEQGAALAATLEEARSAFHAVAETTASLDLNRTLGALEQLAWSVRRKVEAADVDGSLAEVRRSLTSLRVLLESLNETVSRTRDDVRATTSNMRDTSQHLRDFSRSIRDDPSRLLSTPDRPARK